MHLSVSYIGQKLSILYNYLIKVSSVLQGSTY